MRPFVGYHYKICQPIQLTIDDTWFVIPEDFETDLASIPRIAWPVLSPAHSALIKPAIVHDWFYRKTTVFTRLETDQIFYQMLRNNDIGVIKASIMYYAVRLFGGRFYDDVSGLD
jgi:hypothetical protein